MGTQGADPSHRELLDYLSYKFMHEYNWSVKRLIKEIMLSAVYQQTSAISADVLEKDPDNKFLARMPRVRLSAEQIRDQALFVSGSLNPGLYGPTVMPYQPNGIWSSPYNGEKWMMSEGGDQYRRAVYIYWKRSNPYPSMTSFDGVGREVCSARRIRTNTPLQALVTLNDPVYIDLAQKLTLNIWPNYKGDKERIAAIYQKVCQKKISEARLTKLEELYRKGLKSYTNEKKSISVAKEKVTKADESAFQAMALVANAILNLDETITKN